MMTRLSRFNTYFALVLLAAGSGCESPFKEKPVSAIRLHLEVNPDGTGRSKPVAIYRAKPSYVNVENEPILAEVDLTEATVVDTLGGFAIRLAFNQHGTHLLDQCSAAYRGQRLAIFSSFGEARWLGAPQLSRHITDGVFLFTPDATREEAERIVLGLNNAIAKAN
jgi:hypothetical protein